MKKIVFCFVIFLLLNSLCFAKQEGFTQQDRERLIRLEATLKVFMEQVDKRFEQMDKRFEQMMTFMWILAGIFTTLTAVVMGFAYWDRKQL